MLSPQQLDELLAAILARYCYVASLDKVWDTVMRAFVSLSALGRQYSQLCGTPAETVAYLLTGDQPLQKLDGMTFEPGGLPIIVRPDGVKLLNTWTDPCIAPRPGDVERFVNHLLYVMDGNMEALNYVLDWLAFNVQRRGKKLAVALLIIGGQGIGKSLIGEFMATLVGRANVAFMDAGMLGSQFNSQFLTCQLAVINEYSSSIGRSGQAIMKHLITGETIFVNTKGVAAFQIENRANFILFSNDVDAAKLDADDRRHCVWISRATKREDAYYRDLCEWFYGEGKHMVLQFLLDRDLSSFSPYAAPPRTESRAALIRESLSDQHQQLLEKYEAAEAPFDSPLVIIADAMEYLNDQRGLRFTTRQIASFLRSIGGIERGQVRLRAHDGTDRKPRVWVIDDHITWAHASDSVIAQAYRAPGSPRRVLPGTREAFVPTPVDTSAPTDAPGGPTVGTFDDLLH